jgi:hypothetical protein
MQALTLAQAKPRSTTSPSHANHGVFAGAAGFLAAILFLVALLPSFAAAGPTGPATRPMPLPQPGPAIVVPR